MVALQVRDESNTNYSNSIIALAQVVSAPTVMGPFSFTDLNEMGSPSFTDLKYLKPDLSW